MAAAGWEDKPKTGLVQINWIYFIF